MKKAGKIFSRIMAVISVVIFIFGFTIFVSVLRASAGKAPSVFGFSVLQVPPEVWSLKYLSEG